jgi:anti-anti-sigma factor
VIRLAELDLDEPADVRVARLRGELDLSNAGDIADALAEAAADADLGLVLDMTDLRHLDSAGIRMLFDLRRRLTYRRNFVALAVPDNARIRAVLDMAAVQETIPVAPSVEAAIAAVRAAAASY